ncbi:MAG: HAD-IIB family hydrolase [Pseudohongiellaceae bacterium]
MSTDLIVVTDLDGTLLDHHTYEFSAASEALHRLRQLGVPLILNSSKSAAEILQIRRRLDNHDPFIVENGAGVYVPESEQGGEEVLRRIDFGMNRADILDILGRLRASRGYCFTGFADMTVADLTDYTGLDREHAELALQRDYTEPLLWQDSEARFLEFCMELEQFKISLVRGGRFIHLSAQVDKARAMQWLKEFYAGTQGTQPRVIALGDSENDRAMLELADYAVLIKSPVNSPPVIHHRRLLSPVLEGPAGWNEAVLSLLRELRETSKLQADCKQER